jgi:dihydrofolate synthase/folylpolyglutamate synthase
MEPIQTYDDAMAFLKGLADYERVPEKKDAFRRELESRGLERMKKLVDLLGHPEHSFPAIHVAGTKGKGSTCAMMDAILRKAGYRTGLYTSPHLVRLEERISVNGSPIPEDDLVKCLNIILPAIKTMRVDELEPTLFEVLTALACVHFREQSVQFGIFEVGLGGRLDATNVLSPTVSVITSIGRDHAEWLGHEISDIAREKAGIAKANVPLVISVTDRIALAMIEEVAVAAGAPLILRGSDFRVSVKRSTEAGVLFDVETYCVTHRNLEIPLLGRHQAANAATAIVALAVLGDLGKGYVDEKAVRDGLREVRLRGRADILSREPLIMVDGAHTEDSARLLRETLEECFPGRKVVLIFSAFADKDIPAMARHLAPLAERVILTPMSHPRAAKLEVLKEAFPPGEPSAEEAKNPAAALRAAVKGAGEDDLILATGSFHLAGEIVKAADVL